MTSDRANPSGAPLAGGATTPASRFGGTFLRARFFRFLARWGRRITGLAYRQLAELEKERQHMPAGNDLRAGPAGLPSRTAGAPPPKERTHNHRHRHDN